MSIEVLIIDNAEQPLKSLNESNQNEQTNGQPGGLMTLGGLFTAFNVVNENKRIYTPESFLPHLEAMMAKKEKLGAIYGELDHPDGFNTSFQRASHAIVNAEFVQSKNCVEGKIKLLPSENGKFVYNLVKENFPIFVSSRASGTTDTNGHVRINQLFTYDIVADPGFSMAKMACINESLGLHMNASTKIYEMNSVRPTGSNIFDLTKDTDTNKLFNMNHNDNITNDQLQEYKTFLQSEISRVERDLREDMTKHFLSESERTAQKERYENLNENLNKVVAYLAYVQESLQYVVNENIKLRNDNTLMTENIETLKKDLGSVSNTQQKMLDYTEYMAEEVNDMNMHSLEMLKMQENRIANTEAYTKYLAENVDKNIQYSNSIAEHVNKLVDYNDYIATKLNETLSYTEYVSEQLDKSIKYTESIAETLDKNIKYNEYLAENIDKSIAYTTYVAGKVDKSIEYSDYLCENIEKSAKYSNYLAQKVDSAIKYADYIANEGSKIEFNIDKQKQYLNYLAENIDNAISHQDYMVSEINSTLETPNTIVALAENTMDAEMTHTDMSDTDTDMTDGDMTGSWCKRSDNEDEVAPEMTPSTETPEITPEDAIDVEVSALAPYDIVILPNGAEGVIMSIDNAVCDVHMADGTVVKYSCDEITKKTPVIPTETTDTTDSTENTNDMELIDEIETEVNESKNKKSSLPNFISLLTQEERISYAILPDVGKAYVNEKLQDSYYQSEQGKRQIKSVLKEARGIIS